jgi:hypothetical protein
VIVHPVVSPIQMTVGFDGPLLTMCIACSYGDSKEPLEALPRLDGRASPARPMAKHGQKGYETFHHSDEARRLIRAL